MRQHQDTLEIRTPGRGMFDVTQEVAAVVAASGIETGLCVVFGRHTSCSLVIQENADPDVGVDLLAWLERLAPDGDPSYRHRDEGPDDMPAHLRAAMTKTSETVPVQGGKLALGTWQGLFLVEHRTSPHTRRLIVHLLGV